MAHSGAGAAIYLAAELFQSMTGTKMNGVAYRGAPPALNDVMAGHVALMFADAGSVVGHINAGRVRALGVSSTDTRPGITQRADDCGVRSAGLRCRRMDDDLRAVGNAQTGDRSAARRTQGGGRNAGGSRLIVRIGTIPVDSPPPTELQKFLASEIDRWGSLIQRAGLAKTE